MGGLLFQAFIYLCAAVIAVPIAKRLGLGSVLGYLLAGIVIGPAIGLVGSETWSRILVITGAPMRRSDRSFDTAF